MEYVNVPVPKDRVMEVYALLASGPKEQQVSAPASKVTSRGARIDPDRPNFSPNWTPEMLMRMYRESSGAMKAILDVFADRPDEIIHSFELVNALSDYHGRECDHHTLAGTLGAFGNRVFNRYQADGWPFESKWDPVAQEVWYRMPGNFGGKMRESSSD